MMKLKVGATEREEVVKLYTEDNGDTVIVTVKQEYRYEADSEGNLTLKVE